MMYHKYILKSTVDNWQLIYVSTKYVFFKFLLVHE